MYVESAKGPDQRDESAAGSRSPPASRSIPRSPQDILGAQDVLELLVDLRHFCEARKIDFYSVLEASYQAYLEEREAADEDEL